MAAAAATGGAMAPPQKCQEAASLSKETANIIRWLLATEDDFGGNPLPPSGDVGVLAVVIAGGGSGMSSLVPIVYHDPRVTERFQLRIWVSVGPDLDVGRLTKRILESVVHAPMRYRVEVDLDAIREHLRLELMGKRFLLILDDVWDGNHALGDVWDRDHAKWAALRADLANGEAGSKILVTTRYAQVSEMMQKTWAITRAASSSEGSSISGQKSILKGSEVIPSSLHKGSPAAEGLNVDTDAVNVVPTLVSSWWEFGESLSSSQRDAPAFEKPTCYRTRGKFLRGSVRLRPWKQCRISTGSVQVSHTPPLKEVRYVRYRLRLSKLMPLGHLEFDPPLIEPHVHSHRPFLRTPLLVDHRIFDELFSKLKYLRILELSFIPADVIPDSIGELNHLCLLNLSYTNVRRLPKSLSSLANLRVLILHQCTLLQQLPNLPSGLTHLTLGISESLIPSPLQKKPLQDYARDPSLLKIKDSGNLFFFSEGQWRHTPLPSLRHCRKIVPWLQDSPLDKHYESMATCLKEAVQNLKVLGRLEIEYHVGWCLRPLTNGESVATFKYKMLPHHIGVNNSGIHLNIFNSALNVLEGYDGDHIDNCSLAMCLQGHLASLRSLSVSGSMNIALLLEEALPHMSSLCELEIYRCRGLALLLSSQQEDLPSLKVLSIKECLDLTSLPGEILHSMTALEALRIIDCKEVSELGLEDLVSLTSLWIERCPKLLAACSEDSIAPLQSLSIDNTSLLVTSFVENLSYLQGLYIHNCTQLSSFTDEEVKGLQSLASLRRLETAYCYNLSSLPFELHTLASLKSLRIMYCPKIRYLPHKGLPVFLEELYICGCPMLKEWWQRAKDACPIKVDNISKIRVY